MDEQLRTLDQIRATAIDLGMKFGPKVVVAILILIAGYFAGRWAGRMALRAVERFRLDPPVRGLLEKIVRLAVLALFMIMALQNLGVELLPLIAGLGVAGAGIALATQGVLSNVVAGLSIIFTRPFQVGDYVSMVNEEGEVLEISLFNTVLGHPDLSRVVIPNRKIVGEILHNYGKIRQLNVEVGIDYEADPAAARRAIDEVLSANPRVLREPAPVVSLDRLGEYRVSIAVRPWVGVADYTGAIGEINAAILRTFRERGIRIPAPRREIRMLGN
jgi:small conductance mechanosensitive channel